MPVIHYNDQTGLGIYLQFDDPNNIRVAFVEGISPKLRRYEVTNADLIDAGLPDGFWHPTIRSGDINNPTDFDIILDAVDFNWDGVAEIAPVVLFGKSGGGVLSAQIGVVSLTTNDFLEVVQGEEKIITFIVEAHGRFDTDVFGDIVVKMKDPAGTVIIKTEGEGSIERVCQAFDVQVIRCTLSPEDTALLVAGLLQIELMFDMQKARLTHSLKVLDQIIDIGS